MTVIPMVNHDPRPGANCQVWRCGSCRCFHLHAGAQLLTFTAEEYAAFTRAVVNCFYGAPTAALDGDNAGEADFDIITLSKKTTR